MNPKRWNNIWKILLINTGLIALFAAIDVVQLQAFLQMGDIIPNVWEYYHRFTMPSFIILWIVTISIAGIIWWVIYKDASEGIGLILSGWIMLLTGLEDMFYFAFSSQRLFDFACLNWLENAPAIAFTSRHILRESCITPFGLYLNIILGIIIALVVLYFMMHINITGVRHKKIKRKNSR